MTAPGNPRHVVPGGVHRDPIGHLLPIAQLLIDRGHEPVDSPEELGFQPTPSGWVCSLLGAISSDDWAAVQARFELPATIVYEAGCIRDHANWVDIEGAFLA